MDLEKVKKLSYNRLRKIYKNHLESQELSPNTVQTMSGDTFYLWNNASPEVFWNAVTSDDFENVAREALLKALTENSSGNVSSLVNGYLATLRKFRTYLYSDFDFSEEEDEERALKDFLLDIECLDPLAEWTSNFNLFDVLKITRTEIRHSNVLSWLLNPNENHGLGDNVLRGFIQYVVTSFSDEEDVFKTLLMEFYDFTILREWRNIDILAVSINEKFVLCIENKMDTGEHDDQLNRYRKIIEDTYPGYKAMYIFLSPEGMESSDPEHWCTMSYRDVIEIVDKARKKMKLLPDAALLIDNYIEAIRRDIVGDEKLARICAEIYAKHQKALDLLFENKPDKAMEVASVIRTWATTKTQNGEIELDENKSGKSYIRFKTPYMSSVMPESEEADSSWNTKNHYFYEIKNISGNEYFIQLVFNSTNMTEEQREVADIINAKYPSRQQKENWQYRTCFTTKHSKVDDDFSDEKIYDQLDKKFDEIKAFEEKVKELFN